VKRKRLEKMDLTCVHCSNVQEVIYPWEHIPICSNKKCRKPMLREIDTIPFHGVRDREKENMTTDLEERR
jgi:hypothetical protein